MGKSSGGIRGGTRSQNNGEVNWRVNQTQADYDKMTASEKTAALNNLREQYNQRKKAIELYGQDAAEDVMLKATELFFKRNKLSLQQSTPKSKINLLKKQAEALNKKYATFQGRYVAPSELSKKLKLEVDMISNQLKSRQAEFPGSNHQHIKDALKRKKKEHQEWLKEYKTYK